jgi:hypothetical protein
VNKSKISTTYFFSIFLYVYQLDALLIGLH